jgi:hypothetical protein
MKNANSISEYKPMEKTEHARSMLLRLKKKNKKNKT